MKSIDIETIPNNDLIQSLPEPEIAIGNIKDPAKIEEKRKEAKQKQIDKMALSPFYGRICSFSACGESEKYFKVIPEISDAAEIELVSHILESLIVGAPETNRIITWNGYSFDFPFIYKRAACLKIPLPAGCPGLGYWTRKYSQNPHCDLMQELAGWQTENRVGLDEAGKQFLGVGKSEHDFTKFITMIQEGNGNEIGTYNLGDAELTYNVYNFLSPYLF